MKNVFGASIIGMGMLVFCAMSNAQTAGYWTFDEINGVGFTDSGPNGLTGILGQPFSEVGSTDGVTGAETDLAISLDGNSGLFVDDSDAELLNLQPPFTLEAWIRTDVEQTGNYGILAYGIPGGRAGGGGWKLGLNGGNIRFTLFAVVDADSSVAVPFDGEWHHIAASYDGEIILYFLDGEELDAVAENRPVTVPGALTMNIGTEFNAISRFTGDIDRVRISNAFFEAGDLDSDPANVKPVDDTTVAFYSFDAEQPPFESEGAEPARTAVSLTTWVSQNVPRENINTPTIEELAPTGQPGDQNLFFNIEEVDRAFVADPDGLLDFGPDDDFTVECWVSTDLVFETDRGVVLYYGRPGEGYSLSINDDGRLQVTTLGILDAPSSSAIVPDNFDWTHVAVSHVAGESLNYFINGELVETVEYAGGVNPAGGGILYIGSEWNGALPFAGSLDRVRVSRAALSAEDLDSDPATVNVRDWQIY